jgi:hypothetical protein
VRSQLGHDGSSGSLVTCPIIVASLSNARLPQSHRISVLVLVRCRRASSGCAVSDLNLFSGARLPSGAAWSKSHSPGIPGSFSLADPALAGCGCIDKLPFHTRLPFPNPKLPITERGN